jgi:dihydroorotate dehydrogenase
VIATNTTLGAKVSSPRRWPRKPEACPAAPLFEKSTAVIRSCPGPWPANCPSSPPAASPAANARAKIDAGAALVQIYSGLIYRGPRWSGECIEATDSAAAGAKIKLPLHCGTLKSEII